MAFKKIPLTIDTMIRNPVPVEGINQEDNIELNIVVTENKTPKDLSSQTIKVYVRRIDGTLVEQTDQITPTNARKGEVTVKLKNSAFNKEGYALFQLDVSDSIGRITSSYATFKIGKGLVSGEAIANTNEIEALKKVEEYIKKANQELETFKQTVTEINENEATRQENEVVRVREEASRNKAEAIRVQQEATRKEKENERVQAETKRIADEEVRRENEVLRGSEELERKQAEELRKEKELLRIADEKNRKVAESKRIEAESVRVEAEKLRVAAETERVEAESLRVTAEEERVAAETKREEEFNKFESKINANTKELKNARTATTGEKFNSLDERIDCEVYRLNKKIDVTMLQQEDKGSHIIENSVEGMTTDMVIKGRTLNNLASKPILPAWATTEDNYICMNIQNHRYNSFTIPKEYFKPDTEYTVWVEMIQNNGEQQEGETEQFCAFTIHSYSYSRSVIKEGYDESGAKQNYSVSFKHGEVGTKQAILVTHNPTEFNKKENGVFLELPTYYSATKGVQRFRIILLEGNFMGKPMPKQFEGIKSFGQQEDKISILSNGKNLFNKEIYLNSKSYNAPFNGLYSWLPIKVKPNTKYNFNVLTSDLSKLVLISSSKDINSSWFIDFRNRNKKYNINKTSNEQGEFYIGFYGVEDEDIRNVINNSKIQITEGEALEEYEPYIEDKKDISLSKYGFKDGLKSVNDTVFDGLNSTRNTAIKKVDKYTFTGNEDWRIMSESNNEYIYFEVDFNAKKSDKINIICNNFIARSFPELYAKNTNGISAWSDSTRGTIFIGIEKSKLTSLNTDGFKTWLKANPTTIVYQLAESIETPLDENINLKTFGEKTYVSFENAISGTSSFKAPVDSAATISRLNRENRALEEENKNLRQDFESTTLSLTDSDLELVKQNVDIDFRLMEVEFALDIPQSTLCSNINFKNKKGEVKSMARTPYEMLKIVILSGDYDREDYIHKVGKYYERGRMTKEEYDELMSLMTADEVIGG